jgi:hypothetical protein
VLLPAPPSLLPLLLAPLLISLLPFASSSVPSGMLLITLGPSRWDLAPLALVVVVS